MGQIKALLCIGKSHPSCLRSKGSKKGENVFTGKLKSLAYRHDLVDRSKKVFNFSTYPDSDHVGSWLHNNAKFWFFFICVLKF